MWLFRAIGQGGIAAAAVGGTFVRGGTVLAVGSQIGLCLCK
jgi:hypothetical protein